MSTVSLNKSQTSGHNGLSHIRLRPLFRPEVCDLFTDTVLKPCPILLQPVVVFEYDWATVEPACTITHSFVQCDYV